MSINTATYNRFIKLDQVCDYIPLVSTGTNLVNIFTKCVFQGAHGSTRNHNYIAYICDKSMLRCVTLLIPLIGNVVVTIYDLTQFYRLKKSQQDAEKVAISGSQLALKSLEESVKTFKMIIEDPTTPLHLNLGRIFEGTHHEKIDYCWTSLKIAFNVQNIAKIMTNWTASGKNVEIAQCHQKIVELRKEAVQLREDYYSDYLKTLSSEEIYKEVEKCDKRITSDEEKKQSGMKLQTHEIIKRFKKRSTKTLHDPEFIEMRLLLAYRPQKAQMARSSVETSTSSNQSS